MNQETKTKISRAAAYISALKNSRNLKIKINIVPNNRSLKKIINNSCYGYDVTSSQSAKMFKIPSSLIGAVFLDQKGIF